jgi:hypothetical protein
MAKLMPLAIKPYSMAVAPSVELRKRLTKLFSFIIHPILGEIHNRCLTE